MHEIFSKLKLKSILLLLIINLVFGCDWVLKEMCGEITDAQKTMIDELEQLTNNEIKIAVIPCETRYVNVYIEKSISDSILYRIHDSVRLNLPWNTLSIYSFEDNHLLFNQSYDLHKKKYYRVFTNDSIYYNE